MRRFTLQFGLLNASFQTGPLSQPFLLHNHPPLPRQVAPLQHSDLQSLGTSMDFPSRPVCSPFSRLLDQTWSQLPSNLLHAPLFYSVYLSTSAGVQLIPNQLHGSESPVMTEIMTDGHLPPQLPNLHSPLQL